MQLTRRSFLTDALGVSLALPVLPSLALGAARGREQGERVLVVLQLSGGNDGLNTVVPHRQDAYYRQRPTLGLTPGRLHALDDDHGLHPAMGEFRELFAEGRVACLHGVGSPNPDRSHFRAMEVWHTADPFGPARGIGWLGRLADQLARGDSGHLPAIHVGGGQLPLALRGERSFAPTVRDADAFRLQELDPGVAAARSRLLAQDSGSDDLQYLRRAAITTYAAAERVEELAGRGTPVDYPGGELGRKLRLVARLISGGFGAQLFDLELTGFDTHVRQAKNHEVLVRTLSQSVAAFQRDLAHHGVDRDVVLLVFSEFGRRVAENGSKGTDHGAGAPCFLVGSSVAGGLHGEAPDLGQLSEGDVPGTTDFRGVYTALERDWLGLRPSTDAPALALLGPGQSSDAYPR